MENTVAVQFNVPEKYSTIRRPYSLFHAEINGHKLRRSELAIAGIIHSYSSKEEQRCMHSYTRFAQELHFSRATVADAIKTLRDEALISQEKRKISAAYRIEKKFDGGYMQTPLWLYTAQFMLKTTSETVYLTSAEIDVLSLILTHTQRNNGTGEFSGSVRRIAGMLNINKKTVQKAISKLLAVELIFRPETGMNGHARSTYVANAKILRKKEKALMKAQKPSERRSQADVQADERAERMRYYQLRENERKQRIEFFEEKIAADEEYKRIKYEKGKIEIALAKAEVFEPTAADSLRIKLETLNLQFNGIRARRMAELRLTPKDLAPPYICSACKDTGERANGQACDCWRKRQ